MNKSQLFIYLLLTETDAKMIHEKSAERITKGNENLPCQFHFFSIH